MSTTDYRGFVERLAASITGGELRPGTRMAPVRQFAYANGIAASTASRVYAELTRRGLINGEVGRGTFVRSSPNMPVFPEPERPGIIDLEINAPAVPGQAEALAVCLADLLRSDRLSQAMRPIGAYGHAAARQGTAQFLRSSGWVPSPDHLLFAGSGRQGIAAALSACAVPGERIGLEALTYPAVKAIIGRLGLQPVALAMDEEGVLPDAIEAAHRAAPLRAIYVQSTINNPSGTTMGCRRRRDIAAILEREKLIAVEDAVYGFLHEDPPAPLVALAPSQVILVDSLSKRASPGLTIGMIVVPSAVLRQRVAIAVRSGAWLAAPFALEAGLRWMDDGVLRRLEQQKRQDAIQRQAIMRAGLAGQSLRGDGRAYHLWLDLPEPWRADQFVAEAARNGVAVTPSSAFTSQAGHVPSAVRLAFASPSFAQLETGVAILARLLDCGPGGTEPSD